MYQLCDPKSKVIALISYSIKSYLFHRVVLGISVKLAFEAQHLVHSHQ